MNQPLYSPAALKDLEEILNYIARDKPNAAIAWVEKIEAKCMLLAASPDIGEAMPQLGLDVRASCVGNYLIFYRRIGLRIEVLRVIRGDREITAL